MQRFTEYLKVCDVIVTSGDIIMTQSKLRIHHVVSESPNFFLQHLNSTICIDRKPLRLRGGREREREREREGGGKDEVSISPLGSAVRGSILCYKHYNC